MRFDVAPPGVAATRTTPRANIGESPNASATATPVSGTRTSWPNNPTIVAHGDRLDREVLPRQTQTDPDHDDGQGDRQTDVDQGALVHGNSWGQGAGTATL